MPPLPPCPARAAPVRTLTMARSSGTARRRPPIGVDAKWENCLTVVDANGNIVESWTQWDKIFKRPHFVTINPYDPEKHVWVVDDHMHAIYKFTHDGKQLVQTIGTPTVKGADGTHFNRPTYLGVAARQHACSSPTATTAPASRSSIRTASSCSTGDRRARRRTTSARATSTTCTASPSIPQTRHVFVNDRGNHRIQVFDENGKYLYEWNVGEEPSDIHLIYIGADRTLWAFDRGTSKMLKYDLEGPLPLLLGHLGRFPRRLLGRARLQRRSGRQLLRRRSGQRTRAEVHAAAGANPAFLVGKPVYSAWK